MIWKPESFHIELTNACIAKCPFCARTKNNWVPSHQELSLEDIQNFFTEEVLKHTKYVNFCGAYGDPIYAKDFLEIALYFTSNNVRVLVSTNWYNLKNNFWEKLGKMWNIKITFGIDWITQKTHWNYRRGTKLVQVLKNSKKYIDSWWEAVWQFLVFGTNEHEIWRAKEISQKLWFSDFIVRDSRSYNNELPAPKFSIKNDIFHKKIHWNIISCEYEDRKEWYINAYAQVLPCCYLWDIEYHHIALRDSSMNIRHNTLEGIISRAFWKKEIWKFLDDSWNNICERKCTKEGNVQRYSTKNKNIF